MRVKPLPGLRETSSTSKRTPVSTTQAACRLADKPYGHPFGVDVAFGDPLVGDPQTVVADDMLAFAGIDPPTVRIYPIETHIAEKLHAYTMPRRRPNFRVKDLPDIALLASAQPIEAARLRAAIWQTFNFRGTHPVPTQFVAPPESWATPYAVMAASDNLAWATVHDVVDAVRAFLGPILNQTADGRWDPQRWRWS